MPEIESLLAYFAILMAIGIFGIGVLLEQYLPLDPPDDRSDDDHE